MHDSVTFSTNVLCAVMLCPKRVWLCTFKAGYALKMSITLHIEMNCFVYYSVALLNWSCVSPFMQSRQIILVFAITPPSTQINTQWRFTTSMGRSSRMTHFYLSNHSMLSIALNYSQIYWRTCHQLTNLLLKYTLQCVQLTVFGLGDTTCIIWVKKCSCSWQIFTTACLSEFCLPQLW